MPTLSSLDGKGKSANHWRMDSDFDFTAHHQRILRMLLAAAGSAVSREELINDLFSALESSRAARYFILVEGYAAGGGNVLEAVNIRKVAGLESTPAGQNRKGKLLKGFSGRWRDSALLRRVLLENSQIDFLHTEWSAAEYNGEFRELHGGEPQWLCAVPLPAARPSLPVRGLFALYDVRGHEIGRDAPPPGAEQEWSLIQALPIIYAMLDHQLSTVAEQVARQRREIIMELAPRAINHEIGTAIGIMRDTMGRMKTHLLKLRGKLGDDPDFVKLLEELLFTRQMVDHAGRITGAFTNIEKRNPEDEASLRALIEEAREILSPLLDRNRIDVEIISDRDVIVHTDAALAQHVILNVMSNAIEAIEDEQAHMPPNDRQRRRIVIQLLRIIAGSGMAEILLCNNGPEIAPGYGERIFEKGVTTRPHGRGHGQGLFICRLIARYLEGEFGFCPPGQKRPEDCKVCFRFAFPLSRRQNEDLQASAEQGE